MTENMMTRDANEGICAFIEKRKPRMGGSLMQSAFSLLPPLDRSSLLRGLAFGSLWGAAVASGLIGLSFYHCGGIDLLEAADTLSAVAPGRDRDDRAGSDGRPQRVMNHDSYNDTYIRGILNTVKTIAMVGVSPKTSRPSYFVFKYLLERGYRVIPVNPGQAGTELLGQKFYARLADIPEPVDMVDIFRNSEAALGVVQEALALKPLPQVIWMQLGVRNDEAARLAEDAGLKVVMNRCPKIEYGRLSSEISWIGVNSRTLSAKRAPLLGKGIQRMSLQRQTMSGGDHRGDASAPSATARIDRLLPRNVFSAGLQIRPD